MRWWVLPVLAACSGAAPPPLKDYQPIDSGLKMEPDAGAPSCRVLTEAQGVCECSEIGFLTDVPNLYFVLDRSGSMSQDKKWDTVRDVVARTVSNLGPRVRVGVTIFPGSDNGCSDGVETLSLRQGDSAPMGSMSKTGYAVLSATSIPAEGGTPTAATLRAIQKSVTSFSGRTFVVLATDGGPNCNLMAGCGISQCLPNMEQFPGCDSVTNCCDGTHYGPVQCLDSKPTVDAVTALAQKGVSTFVIGVPGSAPYSNLLDQLAQAGGTARMTSPLYYRVDGTDPAAFSSALSKIAAKIAATCTFPLSKPPKDASLLNVYLDDAPIANDANGWQLDVNTILLQGTACDRVLAGDVLQVRVVEGCPTINPH